MYKKIISQKKFERKKFFEGEKLFFLKIIENIFW